MCPPARSLATGCVQGPDVDSLIGRCAVLDDGSAPGADEK
jgi:hypothetical protein